MKNIQRKFDNIFLTYKPGEFLPVRVEGKLTNRREFVTYKIKAMIGMPIRPIYQ